LPVQYGDDLQPTMPAEVERILSSKYEPDLPVVSTWEDRAGRKVDVGVLDWIREELLQFKAPPSKGLRIVYGPSFVYGVARVLKIEPQEAFDLLQIVYPKGEYLGPVRYVDAIPFDPTVSPTV
jgi:hypothetical protein